MRRSGVEKGRIGIGIVKPGTSSNVLAKRGARALGIWDPLSRGGRGLLATPDGPVACELEPLGIDAAGARYELRVTNGTGTTLAAKASAIRSGDRRPVAALALEIAPHASINTGFTLDASLAYERVSAEVYGDGVHMVVEATPPYGRKSRNRWAIPATALGAAMLLTGGMLVVFAAERPRIVDAALVASADGTLVARWATTGRGERTYDLRDASGGLMSHGSLPAPSGTLEFGRGRAATLHVAVSNAFGADSRDAAFAHATAAPAIRIVATPPPRIASLTIEPATIPGGAVAVRYAARAREVHIAIVDRSGNVWFSTTTPTGAGVVRLPAPPAGPQAPYALVARADAANGHGEETRVPFPVAGSFGPSATPSPSAAPSTAALAAGETAPAASDGGGPIANGITVRPEFLTAGKPFTVEVPFRDGAHVSVVRERDGVAILGVNVPRGLRMTTLLAPPSAGGPYWVHVTSERGPSTNILLHRLQYATAR